MKKRTKNFLKILFSILIMSIILFFLIKNIDISMINQLVGKVNISYIFLAFPFYLAMYFLRTIRFSMILNKKINFFEMFNIVGVHTFFINLIPARLGEISYLHLICKKGISIYQNVKSLVLVRAIDLFVLVFFFILLFPFSKIPLPIYTFILGIILFAVIVLFLLKPSLYVKLIRKMLIKLKLSKFKIIEKGINHFIEFEKELENTKNKSKYILLGVLIWLCSILFNYILIKGLGINIGLFSIFLISTILLFVTMLPVYTPAGFGAVEGVWALGLVVYGIDKNLAIFTGFYLHIIQLSISILMGLLGFLFLKKINR